MQNPDGAAAAQRDTAESIALLREAVLRLIQHATVDDRVRQLENWQMAQQLSASPRTTPRPTETRRDRRGSTTSPQAPPQAPPPEPPIGVQEGREGRRCYTCGQTGHIARYCTVDRDVLMPLAYGDEGMRRPCMLATCLAQGMTGVPTIPARIMNQDTQALLDTGSVVTLLRPDLAGGKEGGQPAYTGTPVSMGPATWSSGPPTGCSLPGRLCPTFQCRS